MTLYFCTTNGGFYSTELHGSRTMQVADPTWTSPADDADTTAPLVTVNNPACTLPAAGDLVEVAQDDYDALIAGQSAGKRIIAGDDGKPVLADPPALTSDQLAASIRAKRNALLADVTAVLQRQQLQQSYGLTASLTDDQAKTLAQYAQDLRDVPQQSGFPDSITWPTAPTVPTD